MKILITIVALFHFLAVTGQSFQLNPKNSKLTWIGYAEVGGFKQEGTINVKAGSLTFENEKIKSAKVVIDMNTINHADKNLSKHLCKKDFFWSKKYPIAELILLSIEESKVTANLTIKGITHAITFPIQLEKNGAQIMIKGELTIDRTIYGIKYNSSSYFQDLGNYAIKNEFDLSFELVFE